MKETNFTPFAVHQVAIDTVQVELYDNYISFADVSSEIQSELNSSLTQQDGGSEASGLENDQEGIESPCPVHDCTCGRSTPGPPRTSTPGPSSTSTPSRTSTSTAKHSRNKSQLVRMLQFCKSYSHSQINPITSASYIT